jgi:hypothetical protein
MAQVGPSVLRKHYKRRLRQGPQYLVGTSPEGAFSGPTVAAPASGRARVPACPRLLRRATFAPPPGAGWPCGKRYCRAKIDRARRDRNLDRPERQGSAERLEARLLQVGEIASNRLSAPARALIQGRQFLDGAHAVPAETTKRGDRRPELAGQILNEIDIRLTLRRGVLALRLALEGGAQTGDFLSQRIN